MKRLSPAVSAGLALVLPFVLSSCVRPAASAPQTAPTRVASLRGPTTMGLVGLMREAAGDPETHPWEVSVHGTPDEIVTLLVKGETDIALIPANLASVLYNKTGGGVRVAAINTLGVLWIVETGDTIGSLADLAGRTVYSTGKGATPEHVLNHLLRSNGLEPGRDVNVVYRSEASEVAALLAAQGGIAVLPQPFVTVAAAQNPELRVALDLTSQWQAVSPDSALVTGVVAFRTAYASAEPDGLSAFLDAYRRSVDFTNQHPGEAAPLIVATGILPEAALAEKAIPACNITYIDGSESKRLLAGYLGVLFDAEPASVGGALPGDDFYLQP